MDDRVLIIYLLCFGSCALLVCISYHSRQDKGRDAYTDQFICRGNSLRLIRAHLLQFWIDTALQLNMYSKIYHNASLEISWLWVPSRPRQCGLGSPCDLCSNGQVCKQKIFAQLGPLARWSHLPFCSLLSLSPLSSPLPPSPYLVVFLTTTFAMFTPATAFLDDGRQRFQWSSGGDVVEVLAELDPETNKSVIFLDDIQLAFHGAQYIRSGTMVVPYLRDKSRK